MAETHKDNLGNVVTTGNPNTVSEGHSHDHSHEDLSDVSVVGGDNVSFIEEYKKLTAFNEEEYLDRLRMQYEADLQREKEERHRAEVEARQYALQEFNALGQRLMSMVPQHSVLGKTKRFKDGGYIDTVASKESNKNYTLRNKESSAYGKYQFLPKTFSGLNKKYGNGSWNINNPLDQERAMYHFTKENISYLRNNKIPVNEKTLRMTHFLGPEGMRYFYNVWKNNPNASVNEGLHPSNRQAVIAQNKALLNRNPTVGSLFNDLTKGMSSTREVVLRNPDGGSAVFKPQASNGSSTVDNFSWNFKVADSYKKTFNVKNLNQNILGYLNTLEPKYQNMIVGTSGNDRSHSKGSRHYSNNAVDLGWNADLWNRVVTDPKRLEYGIILIDPNHGSGKHIHMSWGKGKENGIDVWMEARRNPYYSKNGAYHDHKIITQGIRSTVGADGVRRWYDDAGGEVGGIEAGPYNPNRSDTKFELFHTLGQNPNMLLSDKGRQQAMMYETLLNREKQITQDTKPQINGFSYNDFINNFTAFVPKAKHVSSVR